MSQRGNALVPANTDFSHLWAVYDFVMNLLMALLLLFEQQLKIPYEEYRFSEKRDVRHAARRIATSRMLNLLRR